ncbi:MAG: HDOD domain-containing protein, partial [Betaproteobacteria bacterium]
LARVSTLVSADVGLAASVIKTVNSPYFGLGRQVASVQQAVTFLGLAEVFGIVTGALLRRAFASGDAAMEQIWDNSATRGVMMRQLASGLRVIAPDRAYTCGLFENSGMALLLIHAPGYANTLKHGGEGAGLQERERVRYGIDHAALGQALVRTWGLPDNIALAVRHHHELQNIEELETPWQTRQLIALSIVANEAVARTQGLRSDNWEGDLLVVGRVLNLAAVDLEQQVQKLVVSQPVAAS